MAANLDRNNGESDYRVPQNFIPGLNHLPDNQHQYEDQAHPRSLNRSGSSYNQIIVPLSNYIKPNVKKSGQNKDRITLSNSLPGADSKNQQDKDLLSDICNGEGDDKDDEYGEEMFTAISGELGKRNKNDLGRNVLNK